MMPSLLALLALPGAYAQTSYPAADANGLSSALEQACDQTNTAAIIRLPPLLLLESDEVAIYPPPSRTTCPNLSELIFEPQNAGSATVRLTNTSNQNEEFTLFSIAGVDVTFRRIEFIGPRTGETGTEVIDNGTVTYPAEDFTPECAEFGPTVRAISMDGGGTGGTTRQQLRVENSYFECLDASSGAGILAEDAIVEIASSTFNFNTARAFGGAVYITGEASTNFNNGVALTIEDESLFVRNDASSGGAVRVDWDGMNVVVDRSRFQSNVGINGAGGLDLIDQRIATITRNEFDKQNPTDLDTEQEGGAIRMDSTRFWAANGFEEGTDVGSLRFVNNVVCGSLAGRGGGLFVRNVPSVEVSSSVFAENLGLFYGGGLYIESPATDFEPQLSVINNTFVGNEAGKTPEWVTPPFIYAIGGGSSAAFFGVNAEFRNNVVAYGRFGGGVLQEYIPFTNDGYEIGDRFAYTNNLFYDNEDGANGNVHLTGDVANLALHPSNIVDVDPQLTYLGLGEYNCVPEAFYPLLTSPTVDAGGGPLVNGVPDACEDWADTSIPTDFVHDGPVDGDPSCDIGAFGGMEGLWIKDTDNDGFVNIFDCDDNDADVNPGQAELCDYIDNDCNGLVDDGIQSVWYPDDDADGFGAVGVSPEFSCDTLIGYVSSTDGTAINTDCDDSNPLTFAGAQEICDDLDNDCNGLPDDGLEFKLYYFDGDQDGYGAPGGSAETLCASPGPGYSDQGGDCDDTSALINPGSVERCGNEIDDDCDTLIDANDPDASTQPFYPDSDGDGDGDMNSAPIATCDVVAPEGFSVTNGDCNDLNAEVNSINAIELCNTGIDEDCDTAVDEADANSDANVFYLDADGDSFGAGALPQYTCDGLTPGLVENGLDCNDADPTVGDCLSGGCSTAAGQGAGFAGIFLGVLAMAGRRRR